MNTKTHLYQRLSSFYFFFFAALGAFVPYWSPYLKSLGFNAIQIGNLMAIVMASKLVAPILLGWLSDHIQKKLIIIQVSLLVTVIAFAGVLVYQSYWWFVLVMMIFGFFWNASLPLFEALTLNHLVGHTDRYSHVRLWGSIGFIASVSLLPFLIDNQGIALLPLIMLALLIANGISSLFVQDKVDSTQNSPLNFNFSEIIKSPIVIALFLACALQSMSHGAYYTFFSIYLEDHGYSRITTGLMWALGVLAEVALFIIVHRLLKRVGACRLFSLALFVTVIRWLMLALWVDNLLILIFSQLLHAASFGLFHASAIHLTHMLFPGRLQSRGQALYAGLSFGLGGALGNVLSGHAWDSIGSTWTFLISGLIALCGALIATLFVSRKKLPQYTEPAGTND